MGALLKASDGLDATLDFIGRVAMWLFIANMAVICFDVVGRKFGFYIPGFGSTKMQELEWHLHTALFAGWIGLCYVRNVHVRIDVLTGDLGPRGAAWLEVIGCLVFAVPYTLLVVWYGYDFAERSWIQNEFSDAPTGLGSRWIIKGILFVGLVLLLMAVLSVLFRRLAFLFGDAETQARAVPAAGRH